MLHAGCICAGAAVEWGCILLPLPSPHPPSSCCVLGASDLYLITSFYQVVNGFYLVFKGQSYVCEGTLVCVEGPWYICEGTMVHV